MTLASGLRSTSMPCWRRCEMQLSKTLSGSEAAFGPLRSFVVGCLGTACAPRGGRCPLGAHTGAVGALRRLRCGARPSVAAQNSLRELCSLRSNIRAESVYEARCARRLKASAPRRPTDRPQRAPPAALDRWAFWPRKTLAALQRRARTGHAAPRRRREAQGLWPRAQRGSLTDSSRMFERSERSERSEFCDATPDRAPQRSRRAAPTAPV